MKLNTKIIYQKNPIKKVNLSRKENHLNYVITTQKNVFLFTNQDSQIKVNSQLLKKIIPCIEEEFFLV